MRIRPSIAAVIIAASPGLAAPKRTQFWNLTANTIDSLQFSPAGKDSYGPNQCANDDDGTVDADERLPIKGVPTGTYDVKLTDVRHRACEAKNVAVKEGAVFSLAEKDITCHK